MAVAKLGPLLTDLRGKLGDSVVFSNWKGKSVVRTPAITIGNPMSDLQRPIRDAVTFLDHKWKNELTQAQKDGWDALAAELTAASKQDAALASRPMNGFPKMGTDDASVESGFNLFLATNVGRIQASTPSGILVQDPAAQTAPLYRVVEDAPPASLMTDPLPPALQGTTNWDSGTGTLTADYLIGPAAFDPTLPPAADLINGVTQFTEIYLRQGDPRVNRLASFRGETPLSSQSRAITEYWAPGGTTGTTTPFQVGAKYRIALRARTIYGRISAWSAVFAWDATGP